jgi:hypothetical protein
VPASARKMARSSHPVESSGGATWPTGTTRRGLYARPGRPTRRACRGSRLGGSRAGPRRLLEQVAQGPAVLFPIWAWPVDEAEGRAHVRPGRLVARGRPGEGQAGRPHSPDRHRPDDSAIKTLRLQMGHVAVKSDRGFGENPTGPGGCVWAPLILVRLISPHVRGSTGAVLQPARPAPLGHLTILSPLQRGSWRGFFPVSPRDQGRTPLNPPSERGEVRKVRRSWCGRRTRRSRVPTVLSSADLS